MYQVKRIEGCLLGLAIGDALGVPVEFKSRAHLKSYPVNDMQGFGTWNQPPGTWSDDSAMAFCLAESLIHSYNLNDIASKFVAWYTSGYWSAHNHCFDIGLSTRLSLDRILKGEDPRFSGNIDESSNGNGSLMRIAPAALYFCNENDEDIYNTICDVSSITHAHFRSVFSCFTLSKFIVELLKGIDKKLAFQSTIKSVSDFFKRKEFNNAEYVHFDRILSGGIASTDESDIKSSGYVVHTLEASIWCFLTTSSFQEAVLRAVNLGEDTDTTGAVTGALAGLYYDDEVVNGNWRSRIAREKDIIKLAEDFTESVKKKILRANS